jgi:hypothetical protein
MHLDLLSKLELETGIPIFEGGTLQVLQQVWYITSNNNDIALSVMYNGVLLGKTIMQVDHFLTGITNRSLYGITFF